jgi:hypothetical protein
MSDFGFNARLFQCIPSEIREAFRAYYLKSLTHQTELSAKRPYDSSTLTEQEHEYHNQQMNRLRKEYGMYQINHQLRIKQFVIPNVVADHPDNLTKLKVGQDCCIHSPDDASGHFLYTIGRVQSMRADSVGKVMHITGAILALCGTRLSVEYVIEGDIWCMIPGRSTHIDLFWCVGTLIRLQYPDSLRNPCLHQYDVVYMKDRLRPRIFASKMQTFPGSFTNSAPLLTKLKQVLMKHVWADLCVHIILDYLPRYDLAVCSSNRVRRTEQTEFMFS